VHGGGLNSRCQGLPLLPPHLAATSSGVCPADQAAPILPSLSTLLVSERVHFRLSLRVQFYLSPDTFSDWAAERTNFPREVVEMALAHAIESKVEAAYRRGDLFEKRRQLMQVWARFCMSPPAKGEVVPIGKQGVESTA
jgi:hypothetical protein